MKGVHMSREGVYYWKCDRPNAFFALEMQKDKTDKVYSEVKHLVERFLGNSHFSLQTAGGQGNHLTFKVVSDAKQYFIRVENGPEKDDYMEVEAALCTMVRQKNIPTPIIYEVDSSRSYYPFAYQIMEYIDYSDLNQLYKKNRLDIRVIMRYLGRYIAQWQDIRTEGFGFFDAALLRKGGCLKGLCNTYSDYYMLNLDRHLNFLVQNRFITQSKSGSILDMVSHHSSLLGIDQGCLVHKDVALWNLLGNTREIKSVIDWDDAISGDPTDDLALIACFHNGNEIKALLDGYREYKVLPDNFEQRFWLHLLRNIIFKAVIRVGADYFNRTNSFFLIGTDGNALRRFTLERIDHSYKGLSGKMKIEDL
jgi:fructosamine-3-kinase